jgi:hypothetical protein
MTKLTNATCPLTDITNLTLNCHIELWYRTGVSTGTHTIVANLASGTSYMEAGSISFFNVDQTTPLGTANTNTGATSGVQATSVNITTTNTNQVVLDILGADNPATVGTGETQQWNDRQIAVNAGSTETATGGTMTMSWNVNSGDWAEIGVPINPNPNTSPDILTDRFHITSSGSVGIGTATPLSQSGLDIESNSLGNAALVIDNIGKGDLFTASASGNPLFKVDNSGNMRVGGSLCVKATLSTACAGTTAGTLYASNTTVQSADVAENYVSSQTLEPGDVIMPAGDGDNQAVIKTTNAYQSQAIGIVSTNPGVTLNSDATTDSTHPNKYPIALQGRVPVKVSSMNGTIHAGDLLTSSSMPGVAMKATHAGQIIGKALADYTDTNTMDTGSIMVFVNISWADPTMQVAITNAGDLSLNGQPVSTDTKTVAASTTIPTSAASTSGVSTDQFTQLQAQVSSISAQLGQLDDLSKQLADLQKQTTLLQTIQGIGTQSAVLGAATASGDTTVGGNLSVSGRTILADVGITGQITDGLLTINGMDTSTATNAATINTLSGPLKIQSMALNGVDFLNGKVTIDTNGNIVTTGDITANTIHADKYEATDTGDSPSVGEATIPAGQTSVEVQTSAVTGTSSIFTSPEEPLDFSIGITDQKEGVSFTAKIINPATHNIKFKWWIIN